MESVKQNERAKKNVESIAKLNFKVVEDKIIIVLFLAKQICHFQMEPYNSDKTHSNKQLLKNHTRNRFTTENQRIKKNMAKIEHSLICVE